jgi:hypothetical protein
MGRANSWNMSPRGGDDSTYLALCGGGQLRDLVVIKLAWEGRV